MIRRFKTFLSYKIQLLYKNKKFNNQLNIIKKDTSISIFDNEVILKEYSFKKEKLSSSFFKSYIGFLEFQEWKKLIQCNF